MTLTWDDVNARVRGLATHFLDRRQLQALARAGDLAALGASLRTAGFGVSEGERMAPALDRVVRRWAAGHMRLFGRWCGPRVGVLTVVFEDEDRRSLRALLRGAVQGAPADQRLAGLIPTPELPERALETLARQPATASIAALLAAWRSPYGPPLLAEATTAQPDLLKLEVAVNRVYAERALGAARRAGRRGPLLAFVIDTIDIENALAALVLAGTEPDVTPKTVFLGGGGRVSIGDFERAAESGDAAAAAQGLARALAGTPAGAVLVRHAREQGRLEGELLRARIAALRAAARTRPLSAYVPLAYALALRAQVLDLRRVIWGVALAAPAPLLADALVTVP